MTQHVRTSYRKHRKATWAAALAVFIAVALALVLPALAIDTSPCTPNATTCIVPASDQGITPSLVNVGGSNFNCQTHAGEPATVRQFQISNPVAGNSYTDPITGVRFEIQLPTGTQDPKTFFSFAVTGNTAVVYDVGVKGGTKTEWYDYKKNTPVHAAFPGGGVYSDQNLHSTPDSKYTPTSPTFYTASITTFCYQTLTVTPSCTTPFSGSAFGGSVEYSAQLQAQNGVCKTNNVVMYTFNNNGTLFATLHPVTPGGGTYKVVEHIHWRGFGPAQNPIALWYDDTDPYDGADKRTMLLCKTDPRANPTTNPFDLPSTVNDADVLPPPIAPDTAPHTSCMLESTDSAPASGDPDRSREYDAWLYSNVDGSRGG